MIRLHQLEANGFKQLRNVQLSFPARATVLVVGENEAGKSTLFEAVYYALYGKTVTDVSADEVISNRLNEAYLRLAFSADGVGLEVTRELKSGRTAKATLKISRPDAPEEVVTGLRKVNAEIVAQLHGLEAESLRHSCFVEQKGLNRLSTITPADRANVLLRLLDQGELVSTAKHFADRRPRADDLRRAGQVVALACAWREWHAAEALRVEAERTLWRADLAQSLAGWTEALERERTETDLAAELNEQAGTLDARIMQVEGWQAAASDITALGQARQDAGLVARALRAAESVLSDLDILAANALPELRGRRKLAEHAEHRRAESAAAETRRTEAEIRQQRLEWLTQHEADSGALRAQLPELQSQLDLAEDREAESRQALSAGQSWQRDLVQSRARLGQLKSLADARAETERRRQALALAETEAARARQKATELAVSLAQARQQQAAADRAVALNTWAEARRQADMEQGDLKAAVGQQDAALAQLSAQKVTSETSARAARARRRWAWAGGGLSLAVIVAAVAPGALSLALPAVRPVAPLVAIVVVVAGLALAGVSVAWWWRQYRTLASARSEATRAQAEIQSANETRTRASAQLEVFDQKTAAILTVPRERLAQAGMAEPVTVEAARELARAADAEAGPERPDPLALEQEALSAQARVDELERGLGPERAALDERNSQHAAGLGAHGLDLVALPSVVASLTDEVASKAARGEPDLAQLESEVGAARAAHIAARQALANAQATLAQRDQDRDTTVQALAVLAATDISPALEAARATVAAAAELRDTAWAQAAEMLAQLELPSDPRGAEKFLAGEAERLRHAIAAAEQRVRERPTAESERDRQMHAATSKQAQITEILGRLQAQALTGLIASVPEEGTEPAVAQQLQKDVAAAAVDDLRAQARQRRNASATASANAAQARQSTRLSRAEAVQLLAQLGCEPGATESPAAVHARLPNLPDPDPDARADLAAIVQTHQVSEARHRGTCQGLQAELTLDPAAVDEAVETARLAALRREQSVCRLAGDVIGRAKRSVIDRLLPDTREFACQILPQLTNGRYRDLDLDDVTFQIKVWDERFGRMVRRDVFSGGAQDQMALSLRLGFALAALPQSLGAAPAFIFLDEPVASFDRVRREAFVELVRTGIVGQRFDQIFVAEPEGTFAENPFSHFLHLEAGRVVEQSWGNPG